MSNLKSPGSARFPRREGAPPAGPSLRSAWPLALTVLSALLAACGGGGESPTADAAAAERASALHAGGSSRAPDFGPNVKIFDASMPIGQIQTAVDAIRDEQVDNEMGAQRYAVLFKPGAYGSAVAPLIVQVGYYTEVAGLGQSPGDVQVNGHVDVYNRCFTDDQANVSCIALNNFWRSLANLQINVMGLDGCRGSGNFWAVSQAAPMRRVNVTGGNLTLMDYCTAGPQYASGGYIADTRTAFVINGSQQQFLVRDSEIGGWSNGVWNQVFSGVVGAPAQSFGQPDAQPYTTLPTTAVSREKPYLYIDAKGAYRVFVPALRRDTAGPSWGAAPTPGHSIGIDDFFIAKPTDNAKTINRELDQGRHLLFTPGTYHLDRTLKVKRPGTVVLGLGYATLVPDEGDVAMTVADVPGVRLAGLLFDAGPVNSPVLLEVGTKRGRHGPHGDDDHRHAGTANNPTSLHDVFFRIGGAAVGKASTSLVVHSDDVLLDHIWAWRADHGIGGVGWDINTADVGVIVNGDDVSAYGLFVEHYQKTQTIWNGERGRTVFFQSELPYDPPNQDAWMDGPLKGYAAYQVSSHVKNHEAWGLGSYCFFNVSDSVNASRAFDAPVTPGVQLHDMLIVRLERPGTIEHVINELGGPAVGQGVPSILVSFP
jgi:hypothetical protein